MFFDVGFAARKSGKSFTMSAKTYQLEIDEDTARVDFRFETIGGGRFCLAEIRRRRKNYALKKRELFAQLRVNRSSYTGSREISRTIRGGWLSEFLQSLLRLSTFSKTAKNDSEIAKLDLVMVAMDRAIMQIESQIQRLKR